MATPTWKKVIVSGSAAELGSLLVSNLLNGVVTGSSNGTLSVMPINGTGNIVATTGASGVSMTGSFSGSFVGNGTGLVGVTATPSFPTTAISNLASTDKFFVNNDAGDATSGNRKITYADVLTDLAGTNLAVESSDSLTLATTIAGLVSVTSTSFTGSLFGTSSWALNSLTASYYGGSVVSASYAATASYAANVPATSSYALVALSSSYAATAGVANSVANAVTNNVNNYVLTATGGGTINGESNLTFDGSLLTVTGNTLITGDLTVAGTASFTNTDNLTIKDKFVLINSGSSALADSGWISQYTANGSGSAMYLKAGSAGDHGTYGRFAIAYDIAGNATTPVVSEYVISAKIGNGAAPTVGSSPTWGGATNGIGNLWLTTAGDIYIYA